MNENEKDRIASAINRLRPDWPIKSIRTLLDNTKLDTRPRRDVAIALTWIACESQTITPARVLEAGPWWQATNGSNDTTTLRHPRRDEACATCGSREDTHGSPWLKDHTFLPLTHATRARAEATDRVQQIRAEIRPTLNFDTETPALNGDPA